MLTNADVWFWDPALGFTAAQRVPLTVTITGMTTTPIAFTGFDTLRIAKEDAESPVSATGDEETPGDG